MIAKEITVYETRDGTQFSTVSQATVHECRLDFIDRLHAQFSGERFSAGREFVQTFPEEIYEILKARFEGTSNG